MTTQAEGPSLSERAASDRMSSDRMSNDRGSTEDLLIRGTNQSGMRAQNERLVLTLLRTQGALAKSDIARMTGLSLQTVSVIMRALEQEGLLLRGTPQRGRIGQPSIPMSLAPDGASFLGLKLGRRSADLTLIDFLGQEIATERLTYRYPLPEGVIAFVREAMPKLMAHLPPDQHSRIGGLGVAMPFQLWNWVQYVGAPQHEMDGWRSFDIHAALSALTDLPVFIQNDATAACGAELIFGQGERPKDFLYFYFGYFIGGGLVLNGQLFTGRNGNAAGVGPMPVPGPDGRMQRLITLASVAALADALEAQGLNADFLWSDPHHWPCPAPLLEAWIDQAAEALAWAILSAAALIEPEAVLIDGWIPPEVRAAIVARTHQALHRQDLSGITAPQIREGSIGAHARALGAAAIPLAQRYLLDQAS